MVSALNGFGMAIGCMDITGAVFFELMIIYMLCRRNGARTTADDTKEQQQGHVASTRFKGGPLWPAISHCSSNISSALWQQGTPLDAVDLSAPIECVDSRFNAHGYWHYIGA